MTAQVKSQSKEPRIGKTIKEDWRNVKIKDDIGGEYRELKEYFLTDDKRYLVTQHSSDRSSFSVGSSPGVRSFSVSVGSSPDDRSFSVSFSSSLIITSRSINFHYFRNPPASL